MGKDRKICVGLITGAHGVRGLVRLRSFTEDPEAIFDYKPLTDESGERTFKITFKNVMKDHYVAAVKGVDTREAADALRGTKIYIPRKTLPDPGKRSFYQADLLALAVRGKDDHDYGTVLGVFDHGAGAFLEIGRTKKDSFMLPFTNAYVPDVNIDDGFIRIDPPAGWLDKEEPPPEESNNDHDQD